ncbi:DUF1501 domain-containing protein [Novosphingobium sp.]|jgi:uncharacterized protein (DUF1501 family)|uniref:DUF1501 domain-containing protein n=1 Tax=Novosphingobium sp. TaxID=1874826 RepID=UPI0022C942C1|nr:DUF1501 domain-containing protein [Novosphingobium sp.]MCZ8017522.1 DUF1501 domain-containing protein [Novosphingobium sp.]MCZ8033954.1 DUF1501 domain-containing protein [Novosphingobium sp.]MCZ8051310.1 DUF1501 domain-containing protein [Novosphingobium sp.]MCZ8059656.1 DUF1501 domain-containing protein [Novosphingobium sp.]MCZ8231494.1 DUF1501 domain-containing protein [Novosphingobium sp.]
MIDRRSLLARGALLTGALFAPRLAYAAAPTQKRLVFLIQRGAADGLATLAPTGDPAYERLRGELADIGAGTKLDGLFTLHGSLGQLAGRYQAGEALFVHATASPYRDRSHFDGQNVLETGGRLPYDRDDGWMNRLIGLLPSGDAKALALSPAIPTALRGAATASSYAPTNLPDASPEFLQRVARLYADDAQLHDLWSEAVQTRAMAGELASDGGRGAAAAGKLAASLMTGPEGARLVMMESGGWDTHAGQRGRLANQLTGLDAMLAALRDGLGSAWADTLVIVATEFGRTAAVNGTGGTDHGTGGMAMLLGGRVKGGRILTDWPGLSQSALYEGRDLRPTTSLDTVLAGAIAGHFGLDPVLTARRLFPGGAGKALEGLIRA